MHHQVGIHMIYVPLSKSGRWATFNLGNLKRQLTSPPVLMLGYELVARHVDVISALLWTNWFEGIYLIVLLQPVCYLVTSPCITCRSHDQIDR